MDQQSLVVQSMHGHNVNSEQSIEVKYLRDDSLLPIYACGKIVDVCVPLDINVSQQEKNKIDTYAPLVIGLLRLYAEYKCGVIPAVVGATGLVTNSLVKHLKTILDIWKATLPVTYCDEITAETIDWYVLKSVLSMK